MQRKRTGKLGKSTVGRWNDWQITDRWQVKTVFPVDRVANAPKIMPPASVGQDMRFIWDIGSTVEQSAVNR